MNQLPRRSFLKRTGVCLALPLLESLGNERLEPIHRFVAINIPLGFYPDDFFPGQSGRNYELSDYLKPAGHLRDRFTVISGSSHPGVDGGHSAEKSFLTAAPHPGERSFKNSVSVDQVIARQVGSATRFASLTTGDKSLSWTPAGVSIPGEKSPASLYARLFLSGTQTELAKQKQRLADGHSVIDSVLEEANGLMNRISQNDRDKMDQFLTAVREAEDRLKKQDRWLATPKPTVEEAHPEDVSSVNVDQWMRSHFEVNRLALMTDSTRVIAFSGAGHSNVVPLQGVSMGYHALTHHGKNPDMIRQLKVIEKATMVEWTRFLDSLIQTSDGEGNLLDSTQVLMGSNLGNASGHITTNMPVLLAGGSYRHGQHLAFDARNNYPLPKLFVSVMQAMGMETESFADQTGTMQGLV